MIGRLFGQKFSTKTDIPLKRIADLLKTGVENLQIKKNELFFESALGKTYIRVTKNNLTTVDGSKIAGIVLIETKLPPELDKLDDSKISVLNAMAGFSALLREEQGMGCRIASRLTGYENDEESWNLYARLVASAAMFQSMWLISVIKGNAINSLNIGDSSQWTTVEFEHAAAKLSSLGLLANASEKGLTVEFPIYQEGVSVIKGDETSLLILSADTPHPVFGNGLFFKLSLPFQYKTGSLEKVCNLLNYYEYRAIDAPPFFGAWCPDKSAQVPAFVGFWPNIMYGPNTSLNHAVWMMHRSKMVCSYLQNTGFK